MAVGIRHADHAAPSIHKTLALTSPTSGCRSVGIVRSQTKATDLLLLCRTLGRQMNILFSSVANNHIQEEIKRRLSSGNARSHSVQSLLSSRLLSKNLKMRIYKTIILPAVLYGCGYQVVIKEGASRAVAARSRETPAHNRTMSGNVLQLASWFQVAVYTRRPLFDGYKGPLPRFLRWEEIKRNISVGATGPDQRPS
jgi:hypothetical protein